jgi:hypothetical protein
MKIAAREFEEKRRFSERANISLDKNLTGT